MIRKSGVTLSGLLSLDCMGQVKVVAGAGGLNRIVTNVNVMEVPDIGDWIHAGDLLLTTAYSIHKDFIALANLVPVLAGKGLSGLMLKPKRYLETIPPEMLEQADALDFPLLELPPEASFSDIINPILSEILQIQTQYFRKSEEANRLFMEVILKGGRLEDIAQTLSVLIDNSVLITDSTEQILAKSLVAWDNNSLDYYTKIAHPRSVKQVDPLQSGLKYYRREMDTDPPLNQFITAITAKGQTRGHLIIWDNNRPLDQNDFIFIDRAMTVAALEFLNEWSLTEIERRYRNEFLDALLSETALDTKGLLERGRYLGCDLSLDYVAMVMDLNLHSLPGRNSPGQNQFQQVKERLFGHLAKRVMEPRERFITGTKSDRIILLLAPPTDCMKPQEYFDRRAEEILRAASQIVRDYSISLGVGRYYPGIPGIRRSYAEALKALAIGKNLFGPNQVVHFKQLGVYRLLQAIPDWSELEGFHQETIGPLQQHDLVHNSDLLKTLEVYFKCNGNLKQVAKTLYIHYNTILYRIERIQEITGLDLKSPEDRLNLLLGLKIRQILLERTV